jgi:hypothetical protein
MSFLNAVIADISNEFLLSIIDPELNWKMTIDDRLAFQIRECELRRRTTTGIIRHYSNVSYTLSPRVLQLFLLIVYFLYSICLSRLHPHSFRYSRIFNQL